MSQLLGPASLQSWGHARCKLIMCIKTSGFWCSQKRSLCTCRGCIFSLNRKKKLISRRIYAHHDQIKLIWKGHEDRSSTHSARPKNSCCAIHTQADFATFQTLRCNNFWTTSFFFDAKAHLPNHFELWTPWMRRFLENMLRAFSGPPMKKVDDFWAKLQHIRMWVRARASLRNRHALWTWKVKSFQDLTF